MPSGSSAHAKLSRASQQCEALKNDLAVLSDVSSYTLAKDTDLASGRLCFRFDQVPLVPHDLELRIGEVLYNYRCSLDHLIWQLVLSEGNRPTCHHEFPIFKDESEYKSKRVRTRIEGAHPKAIAIIDECQPYNCRSPRDRRRYLWYLHRLNNIDKHRQLLVTRRAIPWRAVGWFGPLEPKFHWLAGPVEVNGELVSVEVPPGVADVQPRFIVKVHFSDLPDDLEASVPVDRIMAGIDSAVDMVFSKLSPFLKMVS